MEETPTQPPGAQEGTEESQNWNYEPVMLDDVELVEDYQPGGFAPLDLGDILADRFQIIHKLGNGGIAIVWLCGEIATRKYCAIKVNMAVCSFEHCPDLVALNHMKSLGVTPEELAANNIVMARETFWLDSPNGKHLCSVLPLLGPRLTDWRSDVLGAETERVHNVCYQTAKAMSYLHSKGLCHGDFRPQNILMKLRPGSLDHLGRHGIYEIFGVPISEEVQTVTGEKSEHAPNEIVMAMPAERFKALGAVIDEIAIVDFGEAFKPTEPPKHFGIPMPYASPEVLFKKGNVGLEMDIWSLATTLLELRLDSYGQGRPNDAIRCMELFIGPIPPYYRSEARDVLIECGYGTEFFERRKGAAYLTGAIDVPYNQDEMMAAQVTDYTHPLEKLLGMKQTAFVQEPDSDDPTGQGTRLAQFAYYLSRAEVLDLADLLKRMYQYSAGDRITASQVLSHRWFKSQHHGENRLLSLAKSIWPVAMRVAFLSILVFLVWNWLSPSARCDSLKDIVPGTSVERCRSLFLYSF